MRITAQSHSGNSITTSPCTNEWPCSLSLRERAGVRVLRLRKKPLTLTLSPWERGKGPHRNQLPVQARIRLQGASASSIDWIVGTIQVFHCRAQRAPLRKARRPEG